jgi:hypothetical protein
MITSRNCPICGEEVKFSYRVPEKSYIIENGEIKRDDAFEGPIYDGAYFDFYCSNDRSHDIEQPTIIYEQTFDEWQEEIQDEFYRQNMHAS